MAKTYRANGPVVDNDVDDAGLDTMVNISDTPVKIRIDQGPGQRSYNFTVQPGEAAQFDVGYCRPIKGAGRQMRPSIVDMLTRVHDGKRHVSRMVPEAVARAEHGWTPKVDAHIHRIATLESENARLRSLEDENARLRALLEKNAAGHIADPSIVEADDGEDDGEEHADDADDAEEMDAMTPQVEAKPPKASKSKSKPKARKPRRNSKSTEARG